jgi:exonuclease III
MDKTLKNSTAIELLSLNTNGLREDKKRRGLFNWLKKTHKAEEKIIFLQETHTDTNNENIWTDNWGHKNIKFSHGTSRSRGVAIILPQKYDYKVNSQEIDQFGRYIVLDLTIDGNDFILINCYAPTQDAPIEQIQWLTKIQGFLEKVSEKNIIVGGDMNDYFIPNLDKYRAKPNTPDTEYIKAWKATCNDYNLLDIWRTLNPDKRRYTWRQGKTALNLKQSRLDYWLISNHMIYELTKVDIEPGFRSDHSLIEINFKSNVTSERGPAYWRFNSNLLTNTEYTTYMNNRIEELLQKHNEIDDPGLKWDVIKMEIRSSTVCFSKKLAKKNRDNINEVIIENNRLSKILDTNVDDETLKKFESTKLEIEYYNNEKANGVLLRSKANWAELGERNTKFFLNLEKRNYKNKCITKLINDQDETINKENEILEYEANFYKKLYTEPKKGDQNEDQGQFLEGNNIKLNDDNSDFCEQNITMSEIGIALKELKNGKSPGTDGFTADFYKFFWVKIKELVFHSLQGAYNIGELSIEQKRGVINLIPKKEKDIRYLKNWRPISLLNTDYKILTKSLATRLKKVLPDVINDDQVAYLKERFIGQNIRTIIDIMEFTKITNTNGIAAFLDFEKAFDTVNWKVIEKTLQSYGLGENFRKWVKVVYKNTEACVTNNGYSSPFFVLERGVRQGCPLSAYLFIMVVELLANKIRNTKEIKGIKIGQIEIKIIQMADDTTVFVEDLQSLRIVLDIIELFHLFAGLKLNKTKTEAMWLGKWKNLNDKPLGLKWVSEVHSLGIFFSYDTDYVVQKNFTDKSKSFKRILDLWSQRDLSLLGKIAILKSLAFSMITYQCCSLNVPDSFMETINDIAYKFLWSGKKDKIKRMTIIANYKNGGLKMLDLKAFIIAQRIMWVKRLSKSSSASWKAFPEYVMNAIVGLDSFKTQLDTSKNTHNITPFYWTIIKSWNILQEIDKNNIDAYDIRRQWLWMNKFIKVNKKEIKWKMWSDKGIQIIHDLIDSQGNFKTIANLEEQYGLKCDFLKYNSLKDAIPKVWREKLKIIKIPINEISSDESPRVKTKKGMIPTKQTTNKMIYWELVEKIRITPIIKDKWIKEFNLDQERWEEIFEVPKVIRDTRIRTFQYKLLFNLIPCNQYLKRIGRSNTDKCHFCNAVDDIGHYFYKCEDTRLFWHNFERWWNTMGNTNITITQEMAIIGIINATENNDRLNACLQLARWHIYVEKLQIKNPFLYKFLCILKYKIRIEKTICKNNDKQCKIFKLLWQEIEDYIT